MKAITVSPGTNGIPKYSAARLKKRIGFPYCFKSVNIKFLGNFSLHKECYEICKNIYFILFYRNLNYNIYHFDGLNKRLLL
jgi:hypothetical protein